MDKNLTELVYILDMSGSMEDLTAETIGGYNTLLNEQKQLGRDNPALHANVTTVLFDDRYILLHDRANVDSIPELTTKEYSPCGMTAMLDAIGKTLVTVGQKLAATPEPERPGLVSVTIITDGYENASKEYDWVTIRKMIKEQKEKYSWVFTFIGANIDVEKISEDLGVDKRMAREFSASKRGVDRVFQSVSRGNAEMRYMADMDLEDRMMLNALALADIRPDDEDDEDDKDDEE